MDNTFKSPSIISFCPGILGLERGLKRTGMHPRVMAYVEIESVIITNLVAGMEAGILDPAPIWTDAKTFNALPFRGRIHGIIGGYPCPGESVAGLRQGHLYPGFIWPAIRRAMSATRPFWGFFENVDDHLTGSFPIILRSLRNMGYAVEAGIYSAHEVGAPHERKRLFILAMENSYLQRCRQSGICHQFPWGANVIRTSEELANSNSYGYGTGSGKAKGKGKKDESKKQWEERNQVQREWLWGEFGDSNKELANAGSAGSQGMQPGQLSGKRKRTARPIAQCCPDKFPKGQGFEQWDWEHRRETESGMEYTIDGYDFRGDLVRAIGNSVVEQTAEFAFIDLFHQHFA